MKRFFTPACVLLAAGLLELSSISLRFFSLQLLWIAIGIVLILVFRAFDWRAFFEHRWFIWGFYGIILFLLVVTMFVAPVIRNTRSWLSFGPFTFQPVEFAKVALIFVYASFFSRRHLAVARLANIAASFALFALPAGLTALQPDIGSALILLGIWLGFLLASGLPRGRVLAGIFLFAFLGTIGWQFFFEEYQRERILGVIDPGRDPLGVNYSVIQSKIAIGSAGFLGKGYGQGPQTQLGFLTEPTNDFILAALVEEWGIIAGCVVVAAMFFFISHILKVGEMTGRNVEKFICLGAATMFSIHFLLNAGSTVGLVPVVGVPFPFVSYGGSNLVASFFLLAVINAIRERT